MLRDQPFADNLHECLLGTLPELKRPDLVVAAHPELRDQQIQCSHPGVEGSGWAVTVPGVDSL